MNFNLQTNGSRDVNKNMEFPGANKRSVFFYMEQNDSLQNMWKIRLYFIKIVGIDPAVVNKNQMPSLRSESSGQTTMNFKNNETFVKESHHLTREHANAFNEIAFTPNVVLPLKFVFQGTSNRSPRLQCPPK